MSAISAPNPAIAAPVDAYAAVRDACVALDAKPTDNAARLVCVREYARLGLLGPAVELLEDQGELLAAQPELRTTLALFRARPSGRIEWSALRTRFDLNLAALAVRDPTWGKRRDELLAALRNLELHCATDGNHQLSRRIGRGPRRWLPDFVDWQSISRRPDLLPHDSRMICMPYAIEGVAFGDLIDAVQRGTRDLLVGYRPRIHIMERNQAQLAAWLHVRDLRELFADPRAYLWTGATATADFLRFQDANPHAVPPTFVIRQPAWGGGSSPAFRPALDQLAEKNRSRAAASREHIRMQTAARTPAYYAQRLAGRANSALRILGVTSRFTTFLQYAMRDIQQTAAVLGHQFELLIEPDIFTPSVPDHIKAARIAAFDPDLLLIIDHNRHEYGPIYGFPIPFINWLHDDLAHLFAPQHGKFSPYDIAVGYITQRSARHAGYPPRQCCFAPIPVNQRVYRAEPAPPDLLAAAQCDLSFVSHLSLPVEQFLQQSTAAEVRPTLRLLMSALYEEMNARITAGRVPLTTPQTCGISQELATRLGFELSEAEADELRRTFTDRLISLIFRHEALGWAADLGLNLHLYGNGWEQHPRLARFARGPAGNGEHLRAIFQASAINLQIYPQTSFHQRLLEGLCSGGFFLIRGTPADDVSELYLSVAHRCRAADIRDEEALWNAPDPSLRADVRKLNEVLMTPRRLYDGFAEQLHDYANGAHQLEMSTALPRYRDVAFRTRSDFEEQIARWLKNPDARREIAAAQRDHVLKHFTYDALLERIFEFAADYFQSIATN